MVGRVSDTTSLIRVLGKESTRSQGHSVFDAPVASKGIAVRSPPFVKGGEGGFLPPTAALNPPIPPLRKGAMRTEWPCSVMDLQPLFALCLARTS